MTLTQFVSSIRSNTPLPVVGTRYMIICLVGDVLTLKNNVTNSRFTMNLPGYVSPTSKERHLYQKNHRVALCDFSSDRLST